MKIKGKDKRRKTRQAKLAAKITEEGEPSYSSGKFNEVDPLGQADSSDDDDDYPLAHTLLHENDSLFLH